MKNTKILRTGRIVAALSLAGFLAACSGESAVPPGDILSFAPEAQPMMMSEPSAPAGYPQTAPFSDSSLLPMASEPQPDLDGQSRAVLAPMSDSQPQREENRIAFLPRFSNPLARPEWAGGMPVAERNCRQQLKSLGVVYQEIDPIADSSACTIAHPIKVSGFSGGIQLKPAATLNCQITAAFATWVKKELAPAARARYFTGIQSIRQLNSYSCRRMNNNEANPPMSEHASGNAIDVGAITLNNGETIKVRDPGFFAFRQKSLLNTVRADSCDYFTTVLGPGYNRQHADHFHFDLRKRRSGYRACK